MAKKKSGASKDKATTTTTTTTPATAPVPHAKPSALLDTRVIYCGDNLEQLQKLPPACVAT